MKKAIIFLLTAAMCVTLCGCKSKEVKETEKLIGAIGTVTADSGAAIEAAESAYNALSGEDKTALAGLETLQSAREAYNALCVENAIAALGTDAAVDVEAVKAAGEAYDALTEGEKALVSNADQLSQARRAAMKQSLMGLWYMEISWHDESGQIKYLYMGNTNHDFNIYETTIVIHPEFGERKLADHYFFLDEENFYCSKDETSSDEIGTWDLSEDMTQLIIDPIVEGLSQEQLVFNIYEEDGFTKLRSPGYPYKDAFAFVREDQLGTAFEAKYVYVDGKEDVHQYLGDPISLGYLYDENGQRINAYYEDGQKLFDIEDAFLFPSKVYDEGLTLLCSGTIKYSFSAGSIPGRGGVENVLNVTDLASDDRQLTGFGYLCFVKSDYVAKNYVDENGCRTLELTDGTVVKYANPEYIDLVNYTWKYLQADYNDYIY